jgi:hypothetical protein
LVQFADDEEPEPAALAFFASLFSLSDLLAAVFELFEPPLSLFAMVASSRRDRLVTVSSLDPRPISSMPRCEPERDRVTVQIQADVGRRPCVEV